VRLYVYNQKRNDKHCQDNGREEIREPYPSSFAARPNDIPRFSMIPLSRLAALTFPVPKASQGRHSTILSNSSFAMRDKMFPLLLAEDFQFYIRLSG
jgi:hypothetical protein